MSKGMTGKTHSEEAKEKMRAAKLNVYVGAANPFFGKTHSEEAKEKMRAAKLKAPVRYWAGKSRPDVTARCKGKAVVADDMLKYVGRHQRIAKLLGKENYCEICKSTTKSRYQWSNKDHKYSLNPNDWQRLCVSCHQKYDREHNGYLGRWGTRASISKKKNKTVPFNVQ